MGRWQPPPVQLPDHFLPVLVPTASRQRTLVIIGGIERWPAAMSESLDTREIGKEPCWLCPVNAGVLALMSCHAPAPCLSEGLAQLRQLPNAGRLSSMGTAEVFRMFQQREHLPSGDLGPCGGLNATDGEVDKPVAVVRTLLLHGTLVRNAPRMSAIPARLGAVVVGPVRP